MSGCPYRPIVRGDVARAVNKSESGKAAEAGSIVLAVDGSPASRRAVLPTAELAELFGLDVIVLNVLEPVSSDETERVARAQAGLDLAGEAVETLQMLGITAISDVRTMGPARPSAPARSRP